MNINGLNEFFLITEKLKSIKRKGWKIKSTAEDIESVADHSYAATTIAMIISDLKEMNTEKVMKMMLIHDLPEAIIGDLVPGENPNKDTEENEAINDILRNLPDKIQKQYFEIWNEFKEKTSKESLLVHEIDKLELVFQLSLYKDEMSKEAFNEFLESSEKMINADINKKLLRKIFE